jgi:hypothetical protein
MKSDLSEHYCCVQKGMKNHIRVIWTHKLFSNCPNLQIILRYLLYICGGREKVGKSKMLIFQGNDSNFHIIPKIL